MTQPEAKVSAKFRTQARNNARSILRACARAEAAEEPARAKVNGAYITIWPDDAPSLRAEYEPLLKPRKLSQTKSAQYQKAYRERKKLAESAVPLSELHYQTCKALGCGPDSPQGHLVQKVLDHLHSTHLLNMNPAEAQEPKLVTKLPKLNSAKPLKRRPASLSMFYPDRLPEYTPKEWPLTEETPESLYRPFKQPSQPPQKQTPENLAPEGTTLIQHVYEG